MRKKMNYIKRALIKLINNQYLVSILRILIGILFIWAAIGKVLSPAEFAQMISNYKLLPTVAINIFAVTLPWIELVVGLLLLIGFQIKPSSFITICLLIMFTCALVISLIRGLDIECGCFTGANRTITTALIEDIILLLICIHIFLNNSRFLTIEHILENIRVKGNSNEYKMKIKLVNA